MQLLTIEKDAEVAEKASILEGKGIGDLVARGVALIRLMVEDPVSTGLGGRALVTLKPQHAVHGLTAHRFTPGDIVSLRSSDTKSGVEGIVYRAGEKNVVVAFDEVPETLDPPLSLVMLANERLTRTVLSEVDGGGLWFSPAMQEENVIMMREGTVYLI